MRPPEFTGGNQICGEDPRLIIVSASMRPPEFTGGNDCSYYPELDTCRTLQ